MTLFLKEKSVIDCRFVQEDIEKVICLFDKHSPIVKLNDYKKFKECYEDWINNQRKHLKVS